MSKKTAVIIGAGPTGLTAAYELLTRTDIKPVVLEKSDRMGGIACTINYKGNRIDIGGHRFFSKSERVMDWWLKMLPLQKIETPHATLRYQGSKLTLDAPAQGPDPARDDAVMLLRPRKSRIFYLRKFFDYPIRLNRTTLKNLGLGRVVRIGFSYLKTRLFPIRPEQNLEQFFINRFGRELYETFFRSYTEKVWGVPCHDISAAWGAQRIKGLSISTALWHFLKKSFAPSADLRQKGTETSLIEQFLYPKYGPGQMWDTCAARIRALGGEIVCNVAVDRLHVENRKVVAVETVDAGSGARTKWSGDVFFSTMPIQDLVRAMDAEVPARVREVSEGLVYRDFITVGLLLGKLKVHDETESGQKLLRDNWIYIQEPDVQVGRLQIFNNWSPYLVSDPSRVWLGLEYFCHQDDELWKLSDEAMAGLARQELGKLGLIEEADVLDWTVIRMPKTYPAYFGSYDRFGELRSFLDEFENLFLVGRNGMHRYNNQDHSMLAAMTAVDNIIAGRTDKSNLWDINVEQEYHETKP